MSLLNKNKVLFWVVYNLILLQDLLWDGWLICCVHKCTYGRNESSGCEDFGFGSGSGFDCGFEDLSIDDLIICCIIMC